MYVDVGMSGRSYGGYVEASYKVSVDYDDFSHDPSDMVDLAERADFVKALQKILLGRSCKKSIAIGSQLWPESILYRGERIARLQVRKIVENWAGVDLGRLPFAAQIKKLKKDFGLVLVKERIKAGELLDVRVVFNYLSGGTQDRGTMVISRETTQWLGKQLLAAAGGDLDEKRAVLVNADQVLSPTERFPRLAHKLREGFLRLKGLQRILSS